MENKLSSAEIHLAQRFLLNNNKLIISYQRNCKELPDEPEPNCVLPSAPKLPDEPEKPAPLAKKIAELKKKQSAEVITSSAEEQQGEQISIDEALETVKVAANGENVSVAPKAAEIENKAVKQPVKEIEVKKTLLSICKDWRSQRKKFAVETREHKKAVDLVKLNARLERKQILLKYRFERKAWRREKRLRLCNAKVSALKNSNKFVESLLPNKEYK